MISIDWHPRIIFIITILGGVIISASSHNLLIIWVGMEINLIGFIPLLIFNKTNLSTSTIINYFLIQVVASFTILYSSIFITHMSFCVLTTPIILRGVLVKIGIPPYHYWIPPLIASLPWTSCFYVSTIQKVVPLLVLNSNYIVTQLLVVFLVISLTVGAVGGINRSDWRALIAYSRITHITWIIVAIRVRGFLAAFYATIYFLSVTTIFYIAEKNNLTSFTASVKPLVPMRHIIILVIILLSIAGIPPFVGFVPKIIVLRGLNIRFFKWPLIIRSAINLWFYLNLTFILHTQRALKTREYTKPRVGFLIITILISVFITVMM